MIRFMPVLILLGLFIGLISCEEEALLPAEFIGEPVFYISANLDGGVLSKKAGEAGYFMSTSYFIDDNFNHLIGTLEQIDCNNCPEKTSFTISTTPVITDQSTLNALPQIGQYDYATAISTTTSDQTLVEIAYTSPDNDFYCTNLGTQSQSSFEILAVEDFDNNSQGQATKKLHIQFNCNVYNNNGAVLPFDGIAVIAVAHP